MALIPTPSVVTIGQTVTVTPAAEQPTKTYKVDFDTAASLATSTKPKL